MPENVVEDRPEVAALRQLKSLVDEHGVDFIDLGSSKGGSLTYGTSKLKLHCGVGVDIDPAKVEQARQAGHLVVEADATALRPTEPIVAGVVAMHFLEHLPNADIAKAVIRSAAHLSTDLIYIRQPFFDADPYLAGKGLLLYWSNWSGHPNRMRQSELSHVLGELLSEGRLEGYVIFGSRLIEGSDDPAVLPLGSPRNQHEYDLDKHGQKDSTSFSVPVYREIGVVAARDAGSPLVRNAMQLIASEVILESGGADLTALSLTSREATESKGTSC